MPRGRHRHSPPLHRLLPPSAIAGVSLVCALGPWVFTTPMVLRSLAAAAAATAVLGAVVMRRWDAQAGKQVADLTRARASDEWRFEERVAELETDLEESRDLRVRLEQKLRAKRAELAGLRNEHAALLRRYATAETERASALEGRRLLEIESGTDPRALPPAPADRTERADSPAYAGAEAASASADIVDTGADGVTTDSEAATDSAGENPAEGTGAEGTEAEAAGDEPAAAGAVFSPAGSHLFLRARAALSRFDADVDGHEAAQTDTDADPDTAETAARAADTDEDTAETAAPAAKTDADTNRTDAARTTADAAKPNVDVVKAGVVKTETGAPADAADPATTPGTAADRTAGAAGPAAEDEPQGQSGAAAAHEHAAAATTSRQASPAKPAQQPAGHFTVPTAVAVAPAAPPRRPLVEGGFDFFGTQKGASSADLEAVQNEDLADVVGEEALALHKTESDAEFKPADAHARGVSQVIDLTAHDETEQIDVQGLRSAAS
ncbi:hypothetical protein ACF1A5_10265 [Streptomyces sp. NPDC014864]|uniref:hypothetical protein n=1 Tax=Streptomyces sp. NPDC014864 TaxID=3364924 RepID=UPI0036F88A71